MRREGRGRAHADFTIPGAEAQYPPDLGLEPVHIDISLAVDPAARSARGRTVTTVRANRSGERSIELDAVDFEGVEVADEDSRDVAFDYDGSKLRVRWAEPFAHGEQRRVGVSYRVEEPVSGLHFSVPDEQYPDRALWAATDHETERARHWLPTIDLPAVRTTLAFHLTAPAELTILANGLLESEEVHEDGTKTAHWRLDWPCPSYLVCFAIGDFVRADDRPVGGREIAYFAATGRATPEDLMRSYGRTPEIMDWLQQRLGVPFPFPKYFQFALPQFGGAMENISLVSWDDTLLDDELSHREWGHTVDIVNVHEMAHSWFGDAVVVRDFAHAWLKESWATYLQACWHEDKDGEDEFRYDLHQFARAYMAEADGSYRRPIVTHVFNSSWDMYDRHLYPGGAVRIHMLRQRLGDDVFWPAVQDYLETYSKKTVETGEFRRKLEAHSGRSLGRFFDEWIYGRGYPKLKAVFSHDSDAGTGTLKIEQTQVKEKPEKADAGTATLFTLDLVAAWEDDSGAWHRETLRIDRRKSAFVLPIPAKPRQIRLDPDGDLLFRLEFNPGDDLLRRALRHAPDAVGRILAAEELAKTAKAANVREVGRAMAEEPFWGARLAMASAVADSRTAAAIPVLTSRLASEEDPRVLRGIAASLGKYRDARVADALVALLERDDLTYRVRAQALESLGAQRGPDHLPRLRDAASDEGWRGIVRTGALAGLAMTRTRDGVEALLERNGYGREPDDCAAAAAGLLATAAKHADRPLRAAAEEALTDLLVEPRDRVRRAAAHALGRLGAHTAAEAVERMLAGQPDQAKPRLRRVVSRLRGEKDGRTDDAALTERLEKLEDRNRELEERIDLLEGREKARND